MKLHRTVVAAAGCVFAMNSSGAALAATPFGLYVGAAGGQSDVRLDRSLADTNSDISEHSTGWQIMVGIRPIQLLGAELGYVDFGGSSYRTGPDFGTEHAKAETLSGLVYAPLGVPHLDLYGKLGAARLQTSTHGIVAGLFCPASYLAPGCPYFAKSRTTTDLAYGGGLQVKFGSAALRAEYQRIQSDSGDPGLVSLGLTWTL
jgi:hypothetical protein